MPNIVLIFPIKSGKVEAWRRFCQELAGSRLQPYEACRRRLGITRERMALIDTAIGAAAVTMLEAADVGQALDRLITTDRPFERWYRDRVQELHGFSLARYEQFARPAPLPDSQELLFEWVGP